MKPFLSLKEVAEYLSVDPKTVYRWIQSGQLPAAKFGGVYRIRSTDLDEFFERRKPRSPREAETVEEPPWEEAFRPVSCGRCRRIIRDSRMLAGTCQEPSCESPLCADCWQDEDDRYCARHVLSPEARLSLARERLGRGEIPVLVTSEEARQREMAFVGRFDRKIRQQSRIISPVDGTPFEVASWEAIHREETGSWPDRQRGLARGRSFPVLPRNVRSSYQFGADRSAGAGRRAAGFVILAQVFSHLRAYERDGFDTRPASRAELFQLLEETTEAAKAADRFYVVGMGSPTGWSPDAEEVILGNSHSRSFSSLYIAPCVVDLLDGRLMFNPLDRRLRAFVDLFRGELNEEAVGRVEAFVREMLTRRESQSAYEVAEATGVELALVDEAFARLEADGGYMLDELDGIGLVISRRM